MFFEKENQIVEIQLGKNTKKGKLGLALYESGELLQIKGLSKIKTTLNRISFLESKGFRIYI